MSAFSPGKSSCFTSIVLRPRRLAVIGLKGHQMLDEFVGEALAGVVAHRILVVEDDPEQSAVLKNLLQDQGYQVQVAKDGGQAHSAFTMHRPDFVLMDLILPGESGFEICDRMKRRDETVPIMMLTEITLDDARMLALRVGADAYMTKPYQPRALLDRITEVAQQVWERTHLHRGQDQRRVRFNCRCGKKFKMSPRHRGRTLTCPDCGEPLIVPYHD